MMFGPVVTESLTQMALLLPHIRLIRNKNVTIASAATLSSKYKLLYVLELWCHRAPSLSTGNEGMI